MIFRWESEDEKLRRWMKIPPEAKMKWLRQMHDFVRKFATKEKKKNFWILREPR